MKIQRLNLDSDGQVLLPGIPSYDGVDDEDGSPPLSYIQDRIRAFDEQKEAIELPRVFPVWYTFL